MDPNADNNEWAAGEISGLTAPPGWEPDVQRGLEAIRTRSRLRASKRQALAWAGASALAAALVLVALPTFRSGTGWAWERISGQQSRTTPVLAGGAAVFDDSNALRYPEDYRRWVFVGSSLGLSYSDVSSSNDRPEFFKNVYIDPASYADYERTGEFPDGTMMILEVATQEVKSEPGLQGRYEGEILGIEASVKDTGRFPGGWAYFSFTQRSGNRKDVAQAFPEESCWTCHDEHAETDHVFTQFYPVL